MSENRNKIEAEIEKNRWSVRRFKGITRNYKPEDVCRLRGTLRVEHTIAYAMANKLWQLINEKNEYVKALGAVTGHQAVQMVKGGLKAIYCSGWQTAGDANAIGETYPDQSLYPSNSVPMLVSRINKALQRADEIQHAEGKEEIDWWAPTVADAEAGFGGNLNAFELMKMMIVAGAGGVHFEDQLGSEKKCGHLGGKVLVPTGHFIRTLTAARLAADVLNVPTVLIARTDAEAATLLTSDVDERDKPFLTGERTAEGYYVVKPGIEPCIARGLAYAPYADMLWMETKTPDLVLAKQFADGIHKEFPDKLLAYNCSPSFNWKKNLKDEEIAVFQNELGKLGYKFQFVTLAGFHALNHSMYELARGYAKDGMSAYVSLQEAEFESRKNGYEAVEHQRFVGTGYFDQVAQTIASETSTLALKGSTEDVQFKTDEPSSCVIPTKTDPPDEKK